MPELILTADHEYFLGSRRLFGVTEVLDKCGLISDFAKDPIAAERGTVVHKCCELLAKDQLEWDSVDSRVAGYVVSYQKLIVHTKWITRSVEKMRCDEQLGVAGTYDLCTDFHLVDLKTGAPAKSHKAQLGAYWHLAGERHKCYGAYLQEDGSMAKLKQYDGREGWKDFLVFLNYLHTKEKY